MARMTVMGSGSAGNGYVLEAGGEFLLLEAGVDAGRVLRAVGYRTDLVRGCLVSHEHGDHAGHASGIAAEGIHVYGTEAVGRRVRERAGLHTAFTACQPGQAMRLGGFTALPMDTPHDVPCLAYVIRHASMGTLLFATDTPYLEFTVRGLNHIMLEADYSPALLGANLEAGTIDPTAMETIAALDDGHLSTVTLVHLSTQNALPRDFERVAREATGLPVRCASKGLAVDMCSGAPF